MKWCHETVHAESDHQMRELTGFLVEILDTWSLCHYRFTVPEDDETQWLVVLIAKKKDTVLATETATCGFSRFHH